MSKFAQSARRGAVPPGGESLWFKGASLRVECFSGNPKLDWEWVAPNPTTWTIDYQYDGAGWNFLASRPGAIKTLTSGVFTCPGTHTVEFRVSGLVGTERGAYSNIVSMLADIV